MRFDHQQPRTPEAGRLSTTIFVIGTKLMTKKRFRHQGLPDLAGKNVVTTAGTTSERLIRKMNEDKKMGMNVISAKDPTAKPS